jgi:citrate synthase
MLGVLNAALVLMADHELASSTFAARVAASTRADPYAVVGAGLGPLAGPLHGGAGRATRRVLEQAAGPNGPGPALAEAMASHGIYPGFGHPLYPEGDPRARVLLDLLRSTVGDTRSMRVVDAVLATAQSRAPIQPNVDFALAALGFTVSMPPAGEEVVMTIARTAGWLAHAMEEYGEAPLRFRPRAVYLS